MAEDRTAASTDPRSAMCAECRAGHGPNEYHALLCPHYRAPSAACVCGEINTRHCPVHGQGETTAASLDYQTGWRAWIVNRLLTFATWATRSASRLDSRQEFGVWERRSRG